MVNIYGKYKRPEIIYEKGGGPVKVEKGSHVPVMVQVRAMIAAGERLGEYRQGKHDFEPGMEIPEDVEPDPTRSSMFDLADASQISQQPIREVENVVQTGSALATGTPEVAKATEELE